MNPGKRVELTVLIVLVVLFTLGVVRTAWVSDDAYLTFRTVDNFANGYGLRWNTAERVQIYTHPLWMFALSGMYLITHELYLTTILVSIVLSVAAVLLLAFRVAGSRQTAILAVIVLASSRAFVDYSTSGLENPLTYLCLAVFFAIYFRPEQFAAKRIFYLSLVAALGVFNRMDTLLLYFPALVYATLKTRTFKAQLAVKFGFLPLILWELFSLVYYGFLFPNTAYAKLNTGLPKAELLIQGARYFLDSVTTDPLTLLVIACAVVVPILNRQWRHMCAGLGVLTYLGYVLWIGGDFMSGRFFAAPLFCSVAVLSRSDVAGNRRRFLYVLAAVVVIGFISPRPHPLLTGSTFGAERKNMRDRYGKIYDERQFYYGITGLLRANRPQGLAPAYEWIDEGKRLRAKAPTTFVKGAVGMRGFYAGPQVHIVDYFALGEPLLARMPAKYNPRWRIGHFTRAIPAGYLETVRSGNNTIADRQLALFYDQLSLITRSPIFSRDRWLAILKMNTGQYNYLIDFDRYRYYQMAQYTVDKVAEPGRTLSVSARGAEIDLCTESRARSVRVVLKSAAEFEISFVHDGRVVGKKTVDGRPDKSRKHAIYNVEVPERAAEGGWSRMRIFPLYPKKPCVIAGIQIE